MPKQPYKFRPYDGYHPMLGNGMHKPLAVFALERCIRGFRMARRLGNRKDMIYYAAGVQKFQKLLGFRPYDFPELDMMAAFERADFAKWCDTELFGGADDEQFEAETRIEIEEEEKADDEFDDLEEERSERALEEWK